MESHHQIQHSHSHPQLLAASESVSAPSQPQEQQQQEQQPPKQDGLQSQQESQDQVQIQQSPPPHAQRGGKKPGRPRGSGSSSSRGGQPSSASPLASHQNESNLEDAPSSASMTSVLNFGAPSQTSPSSIHARTPAGRGRGKNTSSHSHSRSHSHSHSRSQTSSSPIAQDMSASETLHMDINSRSEKVPKPGLNHSFTYSTPQPAAAKTAGRKRARTLEYPTDSGAGPSNGDGPAPAAGDAAKVKGGHSLRKRARIDYAHMAEDDDHIYNPVVDEQQPQEITVSGPRGVRKRRPTTDAEQEEQQDEQPQPATAQPKKRAPRADKQRTASPVPQRRPYTKRKSIVSAVPVEEPSPEQQPSDTELKDTIEVGAPLAMQFTSSSSNGQPSETASNGSAQSPGQQANGSVQPAIRVEATSPTVVRLSTGIVAKAAKGKLLDSVQITTNEARQQVANEKADDESKASSPPPTEAAQIDLQLTNESNAHAAAVPESRPDHEPETNGNPAKSQEPKSSGDDKEAATQPIKPVVDAAGDDSPDADKNDVVLKQEPGQPTQDDNRDANQLDTLHVPEPAKQPSSQETVDSDATEYVHPPSTKIEADASSAEADQEPAPSQQTRLTLRKTKQSAPTSVPAAESQPTEEGEGVNDAQKPSLRPRVSTSHDTTRATWFYDNIVNTHNLRRDVLLAMLKLPYLPWRNRLSHPKRSRHLLPRS